MFKRSLVAAVCAGLLSAGAGSPALADGAASTRNIIFGAAAAGVGTWAIVNHNKKVHQKIDEKDAQIHSSDRAYVHEVAVAKHYMAETSALKREVASLKRRLAQAHAQTPVAVSPVAAPQPARLASTSYGWGQL